MYPDPIRQNTDFFPVPGFVFVFAGSVSKVQVSHIFDDDLTDFHPFRIPVPVDILGLLHRQDAAIPVPGDPGERARHILRALLSVYLEKNSPHPLGSGADVKYVFLVKPDMAVVDTNAAFADTHRSGILVEQLTVVSIARTLAANLPGTIRVKILIEGKERETLAGHADISNFYDTAAGDQFPVAE